MAAALMPSKFEGDRTNGRMEGYGTYTFPTGTVYTGQFLDGEFHGEVCGKATAGSPLDHLLSYLARVFCPTGVGRALCSFRAVRARTMRLGAMARLLRGATSLPMASLTLNRQQGSGSTVAPTATDGSTRSWCRASVPLATRNWQTRTPRP